MTGFDFIASACAFALCIFEAPLRICVWWQKCGNKFTTHLDETLAMQRFPSRRLFGHVFAFMKKWEQVEILKENILVRTHVVLTVTFSCG